MSGVNGETSGPAPNPAPGSTVTVQPVGFDLVLRLLSPMEREALVRNQLRGPLQFAGKPFVVRYGSPNERNAKGLTDADAYVRVHLDGPLNNAVLELLDERTRVPRLRIPLSQPAPPPDDENERHRLEIGSALRNLAYAHHDYRTNVETPWLPEPATHTALTSAIREFVFHQHAFDSPQPDPLPHLGASHLLRSESGAEIRARLRALMGGR